MTMIRKLVRASLKALKTGPSATLSTADIDGDLDILVQGARAVDTSRFAGLCPWGHNLSDPENIVGKWTNVQVTPTALRATPQWASHPRAQLCAALVDDGMVNQTSVGFEILEAVTARDDMSRLPTFAAEALRVGKCRRVISKWRLLEASIVPLGANPAALFDAVRKGNAPRTALVTKSLKLDLEKELAPWVPTTAPPTIPAFIREGVREIVAATLEGRDIIKAWYEQQQAADDHLYAAWRNRKHLIEQEIRVAAELERQRANQLRGGTRRP